MASVQRSCRFLCEIERMGNRNRSGSICELSAISNSALYFGKWNIRYVQLKFIVSHQGLQIAISALRVKGRKNLYLVLPTSSLSFRCIPSKDTARASPRRQRSCTPCIRAWGSTWYSSGARTRTGSIGTACTPGRTGNRCSSTPGNASSTSSERTGARFRSRSLQSERRPRCMRARPAARAKA